MTGPPASSLRSRFLLGLDSSAPTAPPPPPATTTHPRPPAPPHYTAHQPGPGGPSGEFSFGFGPQHPSPSRASPQPPDKADVPLSRTPCLLRPCSLGGGGIADWAPGLGGPFPTLTSGFPLGGLGGFPWP